MSLEKHELLLKQLLSAAADVLITYEIDHELKRITLAMYQPNSHAAMISTSGLFHVLECLEIDHDIVAYDDDDNGEHCCPKRSDWRISMRFEALQLRVHAVRQIALGNRPREWAIALQKENAYADLL